MLSLNYCAKASAQMSRCCDRDHFDSMTPQCIKPFVAHKHWGVPAVDAELEQFWKKLDVKSRKALLTVDKKALFQRIRNQYCSRCFGLFVMRYDELKCSAQLDCPSELLKPCCAPLSRVRKICPCFMRCSLLSCSMSRVLRGTRVFGIRISDCGGAYCPG